MKKILVRVYLVLLFLCIISLIVLSILGSKPRVGYLEISSFDENNSYSNNYIYNFKVKYYDKVFRNSDIYGVYLVTNSLPEYIKEIKMNDEFGTPFGTLISSKEITENNIDNIKYTLKIKPKIFNYSIIFFILVAILLISNIERIYYKYFIGMNKRYLYIIITFLCFLILPRILYICFYEYLDHNNYENRLKEEKIILSINNLSEYIFQYEQYFNDYIPFRNELIQIIGIVDYYIFKNFAYGSSPFFYGKNDCQFWRDEIKDYSGETIVNNDELENIRSNIINFRDELLKYKIDFILMVCPNKSSIYDEYIPDYVNKAKITATDKILNYIKDNTDIKIVYPKDHLIKYKNKYDLYYQYDAHWNKLGAYIGYIDLIKNINYGYSIVSIDNLIINKYDEISYVNRNKYIIRTDTNYLMNGYTKNEFKLINGKNDSYESYVYTKSNSDNKNVLFIRDSFGYYMFDYIASYFNESTFIHLNNFKKLYIDDKKIDIVIFETVENMLKDRLLNVIPDYKVEEINKDLETNSESVNN